MKHPLYSDEVLTKEVTEHLVATGDTIFQSHLLAETEWEHVSRLLHIFDPPRKATILDLGCGVGGFATLASQFQPDLSFILLNQSQAQLNLCPPKFEQKVCGPFSAAADLHPNAVTIQWSLGHGDVREIFQLVADILPIGGIFFIYDLVRVEQLSPNFEDILFYKPYRISTIMMAAERAKLALNLAFAPDTSAERYIDKRMPREQFDELFAGIRPMIFRFIK